MYKTRLLLQRQGGSSSSRFTAALANRFTASSSLNNFSSSEEVDAGCLLPRRSFWDLWGSASQAVWVLMLDQNHRTLFLKNAESGVYRPETFGQVSLGLLKLLALHHDLHSHSGFWAGKHRVLEHFLLGVEPALQQFHNVQYALHLEELAETEAEAEAEAEVDADADAEKADNENNDKDDKDAATVDTKEEEDKKKKDKDNKMMKDAGKDDDEDADLVADKELHRELLSTLKEFRPTISSRNWQRDAKEDDDEDADLVADEELHRELLSALKEFHPTISSRNWQRDAKEDVTSQAALLQKMTTPEFFNELQWQTKHDVLLEGKDGYQWTAPKITKIGLLSARAQVVKPPYPLAWRTTTTTTMSEEETAEEKTKDEDDEDDDEEALAAQVEFLYGVDRTISSSSAAPVRQNDDNDNDDGTPSQVTTYHVGVFEGLVKDDKTEQLQWKLALSRFAWEHYRPFSTVPVSQEEEGEEAKEEEEEEEEEEEDKTKTTTTATTKTKKKKTRTKK